MTYLDDKDIWIEFCCELDWLWMKGEIENALLTPVLPYLCKETGADLANQGLDMAANTNINTSTNINTNANTNIWAKKLGLIWQLK